MIQKYLDSSVILPQCKKHHENVQTFLFPIAHQINLICSAGDIFCVGIFKGDCFYLISSLLNLASSSGNVLCCAVLCCGVDWVL